jgi:hypothetical protein
VPRTVTVAPDPSWLNGPFAYATRQLGVPPVFTTKPKINRSMQPALDTVTLVSSAAALGAGVVNGAVVPPGLAHAVVVETAGVVEGLGAVVTGAAVVTSPDGDEVVEVDAGTDVAVDADGWLPLLLQAARIITAKPTRTA